VFDKKGYIKEKIMQKLFASNSKDLLNNKLNINNLIDSLDNLDIGAYKGTNFENSVIGWISFCKTVEELISNGQQVNLENFKNALKFDSINNASRSTDKIEDFLLVEENPKDKLNRLLSIVEVNDIAEDIEYDFLTNEGLKRIGAVHIDDTELDATEVNVDQQKLMPIVEISEFDIDNNDLRSPYTNTNDVYQVSSNVWMDLTTDQLFRVKII
jgi:hypothetical protein